MVFPMNELRGTDDDQPYMFHYAKGRWINQRCRISDLIFKRRGSQHNDGCWDSGQLMITRKSKKKENMHCTQQGCSTGESNKTWSPFYFYKEWKCMEMHKTDGHSGVLYVWHSDCISCRTLNGPYFPKPRWWACATPPARPVGPKAAALGKDPMENSGPHQPEGSHTADDFVEGHVGWIQLQTPCKIWKV